MIEIVYSAYGGSPNGWSQHATLAEARAHLARNLTGPVSADVWLVVGGHREWVETRYSGELAKAA